MPVELTTGERLLLLSVLPREGDITTIRVVSDLRRDLSFSEDEHAALGLRFEEGSVHWDSGADVPRAFDFGRKATDTIVVALNKLNAAGRLTEAHLSLCDKFEVEE